MGFSVWFFFLLVPFVSGSCECCSGGNGSGSIIGWSDAKLSARATTAATTPTVCACVNVCITSTVSSGNRESSANASREARACAPVVKCG